MTEYIEEQCLNLPRMENGVKELGDLWNCNLNSAVGHSLFSSDITSSEISLTRIESSSYNVHHIKGAVATADRIHVSGEIKAGIVGLLDIGVGLLYDKRNARRFDEEQLIVTYKRETIRFKLNSSARNKISKHISDQILNGKLKASHVVSEVVLGGELTANVNVSELHTRDVTEMSGNITAGIDIVIASAAVTAGAGLVAKEKIDEHSTRISLQSVPSVKAKPRTLPELIQVIQTLPDLISDEKHFSDLFPDSNITGLPIKFRLSPIGHFIENFEAQKLYKQMSDDTLSKVASLLLTAKDILDTEYVKTQVFQKGRHLLKILEDPKSLLSLAIKEEEYTLVDKTRKFQTSTIEILKLYSRKEAKASDILKLTQNFQKEANLLEMDQKIHQFVFQGNLDYQGLRLKEANERFAYFFNKESLIDWWKFGKKIKILLYTKYDDGQGGVFFVLDRLSESLQKHGIEIGVGAASISKDFSLHLKVYDTKHTYAGLEKIIFALQVMSVALGNQENCPVSFRFYSVLASFSGVCLPFIETEQFLDLANLISMLENSCSFVICESALRLREIILKRDGKWKFVFVVDAVNSLVDGIKNFKTLKDIMDKDFPHLNSSFIVGSFELKQFDEGPTIFAFKDGTIQAICFDKLDVLILVEGIKSNSNEILQLVSLNGSAGNFSIYPERAEYVVAVAQLLNVIAPAIPNGNFVVQSGEERQCLYDLMKITSAIVKNKNVDTVSALAELCITNFPDILYTFKKYSWVESSKKFVAPFQCSAEKCQQLIYSLKSFLLSQNLFLGKIGLAIESLRSFSESLEEYLDKVIHDPFCPEELSDKLKEAEKVSNCCEKIISILQNFIDLESKSKTISSEMKYFLETVRQAVDIFTRHLFREQNQEETEKRILQTIHGILDDGNCPVALKSELDECKTSNNLDVIISKALRLFESYQDHAMENKEYFHLLSLQKFLEQIIKSPQLNKKFISTFLLKYFNRYALEDFPTPDLRINIKRYIGQGNVVQALNCIAKSIHDELDLKIIQAFQLSNEISGEEFVVNFVRNIGKALTLPKLWKCSKFLFLLRQGLTKLKVLKEFQNFYVDLKDLHFLPNDISSKLHIQNSYAKAIESLGDLTANTRWVELDDFLQDLQRYAVKNIAPKELRNTLRKSISDSHSFYESLRLSNSLFYWHEESKCFVEPWDCDTIRQAIDNIMKWTEEGNKSTNKYELNVYQDNELLIFRKRDYSNQFTEKWSLLNNFPANFDKFNLLIPESQIKRMRNTPDNFVDLLQYTIDAHRITSKSAISQNPKLEEYQPGTFLFPFEKQNNNEHHQSSYNYMEILSTVFHVYCNDPVGLKEIYCRLSAFNKPLPVVVPSMTNYPSKFRHALPILNKLPILCSNLQNGRLFESPFHCILCLQVGSFHNRISPVNILNSILKLESQFFHGDTGDVAGFTELLPLTPKSSKPEFWNDKMGKCGKIPILVLIHGNCLNALDTIELFKSTCSSTILFYPPCESKELKTQFAKITPFLNSSCLHYGVYIDPLIDNAPGNCIFKTNDSVSNLQRKTSDLIREIMVSVKKPNVLQTMNASFEKENLWPVPSLETTASTKLVRIIERISCRTTKQMLEDQDTENKYFNEVISTAVSIFTSKPSILKQAIAHFEFELNILAEKEQVRVSSTEFLKAFDNGILKDDLKAKCCENFSSYIFKCGGLLNIDTDDMSFTKEIFSCLNKMIEPGSFQVVTIFSNNNDDFVNAVFNSSTLIQNQKIGPAKIDMRIVKLDPSLVKSKDESGIKYLLLFNYHLPIEIYNINKNEDLKLATLLISMSNLILLQIDDPDALTCLEIVFLDVCRLSSNINPDFIIISPKDGNKTPQDYQNKMSCVIENISEISENDYKFNLGLFDNPMGKFIKGPGCQVVTLNKTDHNGFDYDDVRVLRQYILDSCMELNILNNVNSITNKFSTWADLFLEDWSRLQNFSLTSEFNSRLDLSKWIEKQIITDEFEDSVDAAFRNHRRVILDDMEKCMSERQEPVDEKKLGSYLNKMFENCQSECSECKKVIALTDKSSQIFLDISSLYSYIEDIKQFSFQELLQKISVTIWKTNLNEQNKLELKKWEAYAFRHVIPPRRRCLAEMKMQYKGGATWMIQQLGNYKELPVLSKIDAFAKCIFEKKKISWEQEDWLEAEIEDAIKFIFIQTEETVYQMGMLRLLKRKICQILQHFELHFEQELLLRFQWHVHVFAIKSFLLCLEDKHNLWNDEYDAPTFLQKLKAEPSEISE